MESGSTKQPPNGRFRRPRLRRRRLLPAPPGPDEPASRTRPRLRKLRFGLVVLGLGVLAFVSWVFGIMMAVAQDLPSLESRAQYERATNSVVYDVNGQKLATLTNNQGRILLETDEISPSMKEAVVAIEDTRFYRAPRRRLPGYGPGPLPGHPCRLGRAGRLDDHPAVRQERPRRPGEPDDPPEVPRGRDRLPPRAPMVEGQDPHRVPERDLLRRGRHRDRGGGAHLLRRPARTCRMR